MAVVSSLALNKTIATNPETNGTRKPITKAIEIGLRHEFGKTPNMIGYSGFHRWRHTERFVYPAEIVIREVQSASGFVVVQLPAESFRQAREATDFDANRKVLAFNIAGADVALSRKAVKSDRPLRSPDPSEAAQVWACRCSRG
jgi:hypothetical protein